MYVFSGVVSTDDHNSKEQKKKKRKNKKRPVDKFVDKQTILVDKWKTPPLYAQSCCFIPSTMVRSRSLVDNSRVIVSTPCIIVV